MKVRPIGRWLIADDKVVANFHHAKKAINILNENYVTLVHLEYPGYEIILPKAKGLPLPPSHQEP